MLLLVASGCSTDLITEPPVDTTQELPPATSADAPIASSPYAASVCHVNAWTTPLGARDNAQLAVVPRASGGASVFAVPQSGGALTGFQFDQYGIQWGDPAGHVIREGKYTSVRAGEVDGRLVASLSDGKNLEIDAIADDLSTFGKLAAMQGSFAARVPILHERAQRLIPTASDGGISFTTLDDQWHETHSVFAFKDAGTLGMDAAQIHGDTGDTVTVWSTRHQCNVERLVAKQAWSANLSCESPRVVTSEHGITELFFENHGRIGHYPLLGEDSDLKAPSYFIEPGDSPHAIFDGTRTWLAYRDGHGQVLAGFEDEHGHFVHVGLDQVVGHDSFEIAKVDGAPWVFTVNDSGYYAFELCATK